MAFTTDQPDNNQPQTGSANAGVAVTFLDERADNAPEQQYRAGAYALLAALLRDIPPPAVLKQTAGLAEATAGSDELATAMSVLGLAAQHSDPDALNDEYHELFIGLGRGEVVPYGSWYLTGFLMEKPLGELRRDLKQLGFERDPAVREPEDHIAALCEVMALLIQEGHSARLQAQFFSRHLAPWASRFFDDLTLAKSASFYQAVARFGAAFTAFERQYFGLQVEE